MRRNINNELLVIWLIAFHVYSHISQGARREHENRGITMTQLLEISSEKKQNK
ncbi:MAG: hypothetical protein ACJA2B_000685 [Candidatus Endobugula sp.]|jgi:hypothetical protein